jgi:hypothetical protein
MGKYEKTLYNYNILHKNFTMQHSQKGHLQIYGRYFLFFGASSLKKIGMSLTLKGPNVRIADKPVLVSVT